MRVLATHCDGQQQKEGKVIDRDEEAERSGSTLRGKRSEGHVGPVGTFCWPNVAGIEGTYR